MSGEMETMERAGNNGRREEMKQKMRVKLDGSFFPSVFWDASLCAMWLKLETD